MSYSRFLSNNSERDELEALEAAKQDHAAEVNMRLKQPIENMPKFFRNLLTELKLGGKYNSIYALLLALFAVALAVQGRIKGRTPNGSLAELNLMVELIGPPGSGKTRTINHMLQANLAHEAKRKIEFQQHREEHIKEVAILRLRKKNLDRQYSKSTCEAAKLEIEQEVSQISLRLAQAFPRNCCHIINSATKSGIIKRLNENKGTLAIVATEGYELLNNCMVNGVSFITEMYDNTPYARSTSEDGLVDIENVVFNLLFSVQNGVAHQQHTRHAQRWNDSGFMARIFSVIYETGLEGGLKDNGHHSEENFNLFLKKIEQLYHRTETEEIEVLELSDDLSDKMLLWFKEYRDGNTKYLDTAHFMDRIELHTVKLSALLTLLEDPQAVEINEKSFNSATHLFDYFLEMQQIIANEEHVYNTDSIAKDADQLLKTIENIAMDSMDRFCSNSVIVGRATRQRRYIRLVQPLLDYLEASKKIRKAIYGNHRGYYLC